MSDAETKPANKADAKPAVVETKPAVVEAKAAVVETEPAAKPESTAGKPAEAKTADGAEAGPVGKAQSRQAGKGSKRRPCNAKKFDANYQEIRWERGPSQRPKH
jgi:hypothetical protein